MTGDCSGSAVVRWQQADIGAAARLLGRQPRCSFTGSPTGLWVASHGSARNARPVTAHQSHPPITSYVPRRTPDGFGSGPLVCDVPGERAGQVGRTARGRGPSAPGELGETPR
ncbi:hypothetical protein ACFZCY_15415 [Streptomyces sp. NPDC007983]|uniref:hypothetical protein n=1 Tax=Streptomyces sp. NPDC007983 TaxID=3364800 RepID=UPI0036E1D301